LTERQSQTDSYEETLGDPRDLQESQRPLVVLVSGQPRQGKSYLAMRLRDEHSFEYLGVDEEYIQFIESECSFLYFDALSRHIAHFYHSSFSQPYYSEERFGRDQVSEWHSYLLSRIKELTARYNKVVVEGYLLFDCKDTFQIDLRSDAEVRLVEVKNRSYSLNGLPVTLEDIVSRKRAVQNISVLLNYYPQGLTLLLNKRRLLAQQPQLSHEQFKNRDRRLEARVHQLRNHTKQLEVSEQRLQKRTEQLQRLREQNQRLRQRLQNCTKQLQDIRNSNTWKQLERITRLRTRVLGR
jgi:hypothetical protein